MNKGIANRLNSTDALPRSQNRIRGIKVLNSQPALLGGIAENLATIFDFQ
jgi:hypothetical protein